MVVVIGFGNPLLDFTVTITNDDLLKKYHIPEDGQSEIDASGLKRLLDDVSRCEKHVSPGGCTTNVLRVLQWLIREPNSTYIFGGIGDDDQGKRLKKLVRENGVNTRYTIHEDATTGTCVALTKGTKRSLVAHLGAAERYSLVDLQADANATDLLLRSSFVYMESFFVTNRSDAANYILEFCTRHKKRFVFNLSGVYMCQNYREIVTHFAKSCDVLFGNAAEYVELSTALNVSCRDVRRIATVLCRTPDRTKIVVVTNGSTPVLCVHSGDVAEEFNVPPLGVDEIGDTTGAGDAFAAGFLMALIEKQSILDSLKMGCRTARQIIQQVGCTIPNDSVPDR